MLKRYEMVDVLENIEEEYNNTWIRTDFICNVYSYVSKLINTYRR